jgi:hypothetical protein
MLGLIAKDGRFSLKPMDEKEHCPGFLGFVEADFDFSIIEGKPFEEAKEILMAKMLVLKKPGSPGEIEIKEFKNNVYPSNQIAVAPPGIGPGDEDKIFVEKGIAKIKPISAEEMKKAEDWNKSGPLGRMKLGFLGSK